MALLGQAREAGGPAEKPLDAVRGLCWYQFEFKSISSGQNNPPSDMDNNTGGHFRLAFAALTLFSKGIDEATSERRAKGGVAMR